MSSTYAIDKQLIKNIYACWENEINTDYDQERILAACQAPKEAYISLLPKGVQGRMSGALIRQLEKKISTRQEKKQNTAQTQ